MSHTYATLEVDPAAFDGIKQQLLDAGYDHAMMEDGEIDMHGLALVRSESPTGLPFELDEHVRWILGRPNFTVIGIARVLRASGVACAEKAEDEQAVALYWMLGQYLKHGDAWREEGDKELERLAEAATN